MTILKALNFDFKENSHLKMSEIAKNAKFRAADMVKMAVLGTFSMSKSDFTQNLSGSEILKFHTLNSRNIFYDFRKMGWISFSIPLSQNIWEWDTRLQLHLKLLLSNDFRKTGLKFFSIPLSESDFTNFSNLFFRFTQNLSVFRRDINDSLKGPNVTTTTAVNDMMTS